MEKTSDIEHQLQHILQENIHCIELQLKNIKSTLEINSYLINVTTVKLQGIITQNINETNPTRLYEFEIATGVLSQILDSIISSTKALTSLKINLDKLKSYLETDYGNQFVSQYINDST